MNETPVKSYKVKEVAEKLGCSIDNVYRLIKYGQLEAFKIGRKKYCITDRAVADFIERQKIRAKEIANG